jgi:hypothetical protein
MERFNEIASEDKDLVLKLGFACFDRASGLLNHDLEARYETQINDIQSTHKEHLLRMQEERDMIVQERVNTALNAVRNERTLAIDSMCDTIKRNREHETGETRKNMEILMDQMRSLLHEHKQANEGSIKDIRDAIDVLKGSSANSAVRGKIGESTTEAMLDTIIPGCTWENMAGIGGKADFHANVPGIGKILMDIKNHEKDHGGVPLRDRKKLERDLDADSTAVGAVLVATQANIQSGSHCQVMLTEEKKPIVCCLLWGNWERLRDAIETLRACILFKPSHSTTSDDDLKTYETKNMDAIKSLRSILGLLCEQENSILKSREHVTRSMTEVNIALSRIDPDWKPSLREWLMVNLKQTSTSIPKKDRLTLKSIKDIPDIPKEAKGKTGRDKIRDELQSLGVSINADGSISNYKILN